MSKGILRAIEEVFPGIPDYICHFHFLRDLGKDLLGADYDRLRKHLQTHGTVGALRARLRDWQRLIDADPHLRQTLHLRTRVRILGSAIASLCFTATGVFQACCTRGKLWDVAAGELVLREAGAIVESTPDVAGLDPARYGADGAPSDPRITLFARASADLPSLTGFLRPAADPPAAPRADHS